MEYIHNQNTILWIEHVFVDFLPMTCGTCLMWLSPLYFEMANLLLLLPGQVLGSSWWKGMFWLYNASILRSWNCNNDFNAFHIYWQRYILPWLALGHFVWVSVSRTFILMRCFLLAYTTLFCQWYFYCLFLRDCYVCHIIHGTML
jgi:hypothetical protein